MKKITAICTAIVLVCLVAVAFSACGDKNTTDDSTRTSTVPAQSTTMLPNENDGKISDVHESGNNGVAGDIVSDISRGLTELSEAVTP